MSLALAFASLVVMLFVALLALGAVIGLTTEIIRGLSAMRRPKPARRAEPVSAPAVRVPEPVEPARPQRGALVGFVPALC